MSTNYDYIRLCEQSGDRSSLHLGLGHGHSRFLFQAHPALGLNSVQAWKDFIAKSGGVIVDEYDREVPVEGFFDGIERQQPSAPNRPQEHFPEQYSYGRDDRRWVDAEGYSFANYDFS